MKNVHSTISQQLSYRFFSFFWQFPSPRIVSRVTWNCWVQWSPYTCTGLHLHWQCDVMTPISLHRLQILHSGRIGGSGGHFYKLVHLWEYCAISTWRLSVTSHFIVNSRKNRKKSNRITHKTREFNLIFFLLCRFFRFLFEERFCNFFPLFPLLPLLLLETKTKFLHDRLLGHLRLVLYFFMMLLEQWEQDLQWHVLKQDSKLNRCDNWGSQ